MKDIIFGRVRKDAEQESTGMYLRHFENNALHLTYVSPQEI